LQREKLQARLDVLASTVRGAGEIRRESGGIRLSRLPSWAQAQTDAVVTNPAAQTSGVRLELLTSASQIDLTMRFTRSQLVVLSRPVPTAKIAVDADGKERVLEYDDGDLRRFNRDNTVEHLAGDATTARIQLDDVHTPRKVVIWLPTDAEVELLDLAANRGIEAAPRDQLRWTHYGSSISHCDGADDPLGPWPVMTARALNVDLYSLGIAGAAQIDGFAARSIRDEDADLITLKMGINVVNADSLRMRTFRPAVHSFLDTIRDGHPTTPILLISPILCPPHEDAPGPTEWSADWKALATSLPGRPTDGQLTLGAIRTTLSDIVEQRSRADVNLHYLDGRKLFGEADAHHLPDDLHPDQVGYRLMSARFTGFLRAGADRFLPETMASSHLSPSVT
jgi:hypothetical protein